VFGCGWLKGDYEYVSLKRGNGGENFGDEIVFRGGKL